MSVQIKPRIRREQGSWICIGDDIRAVSITALGAYAEWSRVKYFYGVGYR